MTDDPGGTMPLAYYLAGGIIALFTITLPLLVVIQPYSTNDQTLVRSVQQGRLYLL